MRSFLWCLFHFEHLLSIWSTKATTQKTIQRPANATYKRSSEHLFPSLVIWDKAWLCFTVHLQQRYTVGGQAGKCPGIPKNLYCCCGSAEWPGLGAGYFWSENSTTANILCDLGQRGWASVFTSPRVCEYRIRHRLQLWSSYMGSHDTGVTTTIRQSLGEAICLF